MNHELGPRFGGARVRFGPVGSVPMPDERSRDSRPGSRGGGEGKPGAKRGSSGPGGRKSTTGKGSKRTAAPRSGPRSSPDERDGRPKGRRPERDDRRAGADTTAGERRAPGPDLAGPAKWGRIARGGAGRMESPAIGTEGYDDFPAKRPRRPRPSADEDATSRAGEPASGDESTAVASPEPETATERKGPPKRERSLPGAADLERHATDAVRRGRRSTVRERKPLGARPQRVEDPAVVLARLVGADRARSLNRKLNDAGRAFQAERFADARTLLRPVVKEAPSLPEGRELMGLTLYRLGRWREAIDQLELFRELTDSTEQHPVLADCYRALGRLDDVEFLWEELGDASPSSEIVTEGRIVLAGSYADDGDLARAIRTLQSGWKLPRQPGDQHLRRAYALADFYDRAGKTARARELFKWVASHEPRFADVTTRVRQLS